MALFWIVCVVVVVAVVLVVLVVVVIVLIDVVVAVIRIVHLHFFFLERRRCRRIAYGCDVLCFLAQTNVWGKQQFAQHLFLHQSPAHGYAKVSCLSVSGIFTVLVCGGLPLVY